MTTKEVATELGSKSALGSRVLPAHGRIAPKHVSQRRPVCVAGRSTGKRDGKAQVVRAVAAPEKEAFSPPPFEAWNTGAVVKKRTDIKTIMILGAGPIVIGQVLASSAFLRLFNGIFFPFCVLLTYIAVRSGLRIRLLRHPGVQSPQVRSIF